MQKWPLKSLTDWRANRPTEGSTNTAASIVACTELIILINHRKQETNVNRRYQVPPSKSYLGESHASVAGSAGAALGLITADSAATRVASLTFISTTCQTTDLRQLVLRLLR